MAANPRKFSEKIAQLRAKELESTTAFNSIINDVSRITKEPGTNIGYSGIGGVLKQVSPHGVPYPPFKTGSLPNINQSLQMQQKQMHMHQHLQQQQVPHMQTSPGDHTLQHNLLNMSGSGSIDIQGAINDLNNLKSENDRRRYLPPQFAPTGVRQQRSRTTDHSPYFPYLAPHPLSGPDSKRFKSDSDIHGSIKHAQPAASTNGNDSPNNGINSPLIHRRVLEVGATTGMMPPDIRNGPSNQQTIYPDGFLSNGLSMPLRIPLSMSAIPQHISPGHQTQPYNHAGSLPDLSNLGFSNNPPSGQCSPPNDGYGRIVSTSMPPPDSPSAIRPNSSRQHSPLIGSPTQVKQMQGNAPHFQYFPHPTVPLNIAGLSGIPPPAHLKGSVPNNIGGPLQKPNLEKQMVNETIRRRISDKMLAQQQAQHYRNSESVPSPNSPGSSTPPIRSPDNNNSSSQCNDIMSSYSMSPSTLSLQQQFDQVKMDGSYSNANGMYSNGCIATPHYINDHRFPIRQHSIPDIILTGTDDSYRSYLSKDPIHSGSMSDSFDANDMFSGDEHFKSELTPLDLEGLQMLDDPSTVLADPGTEDQLRLC